MNITSLIEKIYYVFRNLKLVFIGLNSLRDPNKYVNVDGTPANFTNWVPGEPNSVAERCVHFWNIPIYKGWNDIQCSTQLHYLCKRSKKGNNQKVLLPSQIKKETTLKISSLLIIVSFAVLLKSKVEMQVI